MDRNISESEVVENFLGLRGTFIRTITRANGDVDRKALPNIVTADGLN